MDVAKARFLQQDFGPLLKSIPAHTAPLWGKMSLQQMVEHFTDAVRIAAGKAPELPIVTTAENLPKMRAFLVSDKPFRENTRNPLLPETPAPVRLPSIEAAIEDLQWEISSFFETFTTTENRSTRNPLFGDLDFDMNVQLLYKHAVHHLRQFGVMIASPHSNPSL